MTRAHHANRHELAEAWPSIRLAPRDHGRVELIVRRPGIGLREVLDEATLDPEVGLVGDDWKVRGCGRTEDGSAHPGMQIAITSARAIAAVARERSRWALAGAQLFLALPRSEEHLPAGPRLVIGSAVLEITGLPHNGCKKFLDRFGMDAIRFLASPEGRARRLRGIYARVVAHGVVRTGDEVRRVPAL